MQTRERAHFARSVFPFIKKRKKKRKKKKIKDLYSPFQCPELPSDHSERLIFAVVGWQFRTSLRMEMVSTNLLSCVLTILYHLLYCKMVSDRFFIIYFF